MKLHPISHPCPLGNKAKLYMKPMPDGRLLCTQCTKPVKDLSGIPQAEIDAFIRDNPGTCVIMSARTKPPAG